MIALNSANIETTTVGGTTVDTANVAIAGSETTDFQAGIITLTLPLGAGSTNAAFAQSRYAAPVQVSINYKAGTFSYGTTTGTISSPILANIVAYVVAYRNGLEAIAQIAGATPGTITAWTTATS